MTERFTALVLAARRDGVDPVAAAGQCSHKGLVPMGGQAMLARVLSALVASRSVGALAISIDDPAALMAAPDIAAFQLFLLDHLTRIPGVASIKSSFALKQVSYRTALPLSHIGEPAAEGAG